MKRRLARGFNIIELITVVALVAIMAAVAMPMLNTTIRQSRLTGAVNRVTNDLRYAQGQAVTRGSMQRIHFGADPLVGKPGYYRAEQSVDGGITWTGTSPWYAPSTDYTGASITAITDNVSAAIVEVRFNSQGAAANTGVITYPIKITLTGSSGTKTIQVMRTGSIRVP